MSETGWSLDRVSEVCFSKDLLKNNSVEEEVGAAVERESLDSSSSSRALRTPRCSAIRSMVSARLLTVQVEDIVSRGPI